MSKEYENESLRNVWGKLSSEQSESIGAPYKQEPNIIYETHFIRGPANQSFPEGRRLAVQVSGDPDGYPVFLFHGSPGSRTGVLPTEDELREKEIKLITYDRPGYGYSDPNPGRSPWDSVADMKAIVAYLKEKAVLGAEEKFSIVGRSGGGPHALACAVGLEGVERVASVVTPAPLYFMGKQGVDNMNEANTRAFEDETKTAVENLKTRMAIMREKGPQALPQLWWDQTNPIDRQVMSELGDRRICELGDKGIAEIGSELLDSYMKAVEYGDDGWVDDLLGVRDFWRFCPRDPVMPKNNLKDILIGYGGIDPFTSKEQGEYLVSNLKDGYIPVSEMFIPDGSHFDTGFGRVLRILEWCKTGEEIHEPGVSFTKHPALDATQAVTFGEEGAEIIKLLWADNPDSVKAIREYMPGDVIDPKKMAYDFFLPYIEDLTPTEIKKVLLATHEAYSQTSPPLTPSLAASILRKSLGDKITPRPLEISEALGIADKEFSDLSPEELRDFVRVANCLTRRELETIVNVAKEITSGFDNDGIRSKNIKATVLLAAYDTNFSSIITALDHRNRYDAPDSFIELNAPGDLFWIYKEFNALYSSLESSPVSGVGYDRTSRAIQGALSRYSDADAITMGYYCSFRPTVEQLSVPVAVIAGRRYVLPRNFSLSQDALTPSAIGEELGIGRKKMRELTPGDLLKVTQKGSGFTEEKIASVKLKEYVHSSGRH